MLVEEAVLRHLVGDHLAERAAVEVGPLLHLHETGDHRLGRHHPRDAQPRGEGLAERREVQHVAGELALPLRAVVELGVDLDDRGQVLPLVAELSVGVVLDDGRAVVVGELDEAPAPLEAQGDTRGVLEVREDVEELRPAAQLGLEPPDVEAVVVHGDGEVVRLVGAPRLEGPQVGRRLGEDAVARVHEELADEVEPLLRARGDHDVRGLHLDAVARHVPHQELAQRQVAFGGRVLEGRLALLLQHFPGGALDLGDREDLGRGQPPGERDDVGLLGELQQLPDDRARHPLRALGESLVPQGGNGRSVPLAVQRGNGLPGFHLESRDRHGCPSAKALRAQPAPQRGQASTLPRPAPATSSGEP